MNDNFETLAAQIWAAIKEAKSVLLHCHPSPDPDSVGSALAMLHFLEGQGKQVTLIKGDSEIPDFTQFLPGHEKIVAKNYFEIDPNIFDLFIILDSGDPSRVSSLNDIKFPETLKTILIDHHATTNNFATISFVDQSYAATAEMLTDLFRHWQTAVSPQMAICLLLGIYTDTGGFKFANTTARTFDNAAYLAKIVPDYTKTIFQLENNNSKDLIRFEALALNSITTHFNDRVAISAIGYEQFQSLQIGENNTKGMTIANLLKSVKGWDIAITLYEWQPGIVKMSVRTRDANTYDLTKLAVLVGGGGHKAAAGALIKQPLSEARALVLAKLGEAYPSLA